MPRVRCVDLGTMTACSFLEIWVEEGPCVAAGVWENVGVEGGGQSKFGVHCALHAGNIR